MHDESVTLPDLNKYLDEHISKNYDYFVNLGGIVEAGLLKLEGTVEFNWSHEWRHRAFNKNYSDALMEKAGLEIRGQNPELHFTPLENSLAKKLRAKYRNKFLILWSLSGSSFHKTYPFAEYVGEALYKHKDIEILTVGDDLCQLLEWRNDRTHNHSGIWPIRKSMIMAKYADLVIGTETGILNAASAFDTPKIIMLSHSSVENLTKYWTNTTNLWANVHCYPCHCLNRTGQGCDTDPSIKAPVCMSYIESKDVYSAIMKVYHEWKGEKCQQSIEVQDAFMRRKEGFTTMNRRQLNSIL